MSDSSSLSSEMVKAAIHQLQQARRALLRGERSCARRHIRIARRLIQKACSRTTSA
ncbi:hypothetical protein [Paenibacillus sp. CCS19]|uniref:hypothetical protein n=1 Tax=Paenibacillus sp. CCS19 TaxID=3158387 RepID=UPI00295F0CAA|nr:hypothetical protein [Paenibacillus cellulosilyticus]